MEVLFSLCLPRDEVSVPVVRHICRGAMQRLGISDPCRSDIEVAVTEACTNVLKHAAGTDDEYKVLVQLTESTCEISVVDTGVGFDLDGLRIMGAGAESGRGVMLMHALVDDLNFHSEPERGTVVHLVKRLELEEASILHRLASPDRARA